MMTNTEAAKKLVEEGWLMLPAKDEFGYFTAFIPENVAVKIMKLVDQHLKQELRRK